MLLIELTCENFRGLSTMSVAPGPGVNLIRGDNAQGKTSILEALLYLATSKSHRTNLESELARRGESGFRIAALVRRQDRDVNVEAVWWQGSKRIRVNGVNQARVSEILGKIIVVFFSPEDVALVRGSAAQRRTFLDMELSQISPRYLHALQQYRQAVKQRNELLRQQQPDDALLDAWDAQLATHGATLMEERRQFVEQLAPGAAQAYEAIAEKEPMVLGYKPDVRMDASLSEILAASRKTDIRQGMTTRGPHRDDLSFDVDEKAARPFASQGQQKTAALALKLAELDLVRARTGEYPILMLDDVFSELDAGRSRRLLTAIPPEAQCLMTTTDLTAREDLFGASCARFHIQAG
ncbi:MAG: DNA replication/repair protein RecF, partial [Candidatus Hydrogenedentes bacterium]|nr:DNA replication/repair protein RecF [Candidatus Hydrogenedentota bacterium]